MKHLKKFNENSSIGTGGVPTAILDKPKITPEDLQTYIDYVFRDTNFDSCTKMITDLVKKHPYIKTEEPYAAIYQDALERWHEEKYSEVNSPSEENSENSENDISFSSSVTQKIINKSKITPEDLQTYIDYAFKNDHFETGTQMIVDLKKAHPYIKTEEPYAAIYQDALERWHEEKYSKQ